MRILITNDDGIHSEGLSALETIARTLSDDLWVVAPEFDQSGVAHSLSLSDPLRLRQVDERRFAVKGTPTDCVIMAARAILPAMPDLVLSGVNTGFNIAEDVTYSGTIAAAMEGTILGVPSIAFSQGHGPGGRRKPDYSCAATHGPAVLRKLLDVGFTPGILYNVNFPNRKGDEAVETTVTRQGRREPDWLRLEPRQDGRGLPYYWIGFSVKKTSPEPGTDLAALAEGKISITPLRIDLTDRPTLAKLNDAFR